MFRNEAVLISIQLGWEPTTDSDSERSRARGPLRPLRELALASAAPAAVGFDAHG